MDLHARVRERHQGRSTRSRPSRRAGPPVRAGRRSPGADAAVDAVHARVQRVQVELEPLRVRLSVQRQERRHRRRSRSTSRSTSSDGRSTPDVWSPAVTVTGAARRRTPEGSRGAGRPIRDPRTRCGRGVHAARAGHRAHLPRLGHRQLRARRDRDVRCVLLLPDAGRGPRLAGRGGDPGRGAVCRAPRRRDPERHPPLHARGGAARAAGGDARRADRAPGTRRPEALGQRLPPGRPVPADAQLHPARMVRIRRRAGTRRRAAGPADPARDRHRAHVRAVGVHPVHEDRARDLGERRERASGVGARLVAEPARHRHVGDRRCDRRASPASCWRRTPG